MRLQPLQLAPSFSVDSAQGGTITLEQFAGQPLLLMFHRYAGCPMCNIRLHDFARRFRQWHEGGLEAVAFFHSPPAYINQHAGGKQYPFAIAADPKFRVYRKYGVATSWSRLVLSIARPSVYLDLIRALRHGYRGGKITPRLATMPADFFIRPDGSIHAIYYGRSIADHMPNDQIDEALHESTG